MKFCARLVGLLVSLVLAAAALVSCAGSDDSKGTVEVQDIYGEQSLPASPERVVTLSWQETDIALSLGVQPVGIAAFTLTGGTTAPWQDPLIKGGPKTFDTAPKGDTASVTLDVEALAALKPDLIVATSFVDLDAHRARLMEIAPVLGPTKKDYKDVTWQDQLTHVGKALGKESEAKSLITDVDGKIAAVRTAHPELNGVSYTLGMGVADRFKAVNEPQDAGSKLLEAVGLKMSDRARALKGSGDGSGSADVSFENVDQLDADVLLMAYFPPTLQPELEKGAGFRQLPVVAAGRYSVITLETLTALRNSSPLSIQYTLDELITKVIAPLAAKVKR